MRLKEMTFEIPAEMEKELNRLKASLHKSLKNQLKKTERKVEELHTTLETSQRWQQVAHEGLLLQSHIYRWSKGLSQICVEDWEDNGAERQIMLTPGLTAGEEVALRMRQSKKMHRALPHLKREIEKAEARRNILLDQLERFAKLHTLAELEQFRAEMPLGASPQKKPVSKATQARIPYNEFWSAAGMPIWVGKKATDNDKLTFSLANGNDFWLHAAGCPGSHVVIKCGKNQVPDQETVEDALQLALAYSKAKNESHGEVIFTQCKYLSRYGKIAGKVQVSEHKKLYVRASNERLKTIRLRKKM